MIQKFKDLLTSVDVLNTLHGGISEPFISFREDKRGRQMRVRVPGVERELMQVEIHKNMLSVFYLIPVNSGESLIHMPQVVYNQNIPSMIESSAIKAVYSGNELVVKMPFGKMSSNDRKIEIGDE